METILVTGGTGMVGTALVKLLLRKGYAVIVLTRNPEKLKNKIQGVSYAFWSVENRQIDESAFAASDYVIHLAGAGIADKRWTKDRKNEIRDSRVKSGELLKYYIENKNNKVKGIISSSAVGWYGPDEKAGNMHSFTEEAPAYNDFLGNVCEEWEGAIKTITAPIRKVILRLGVVLAKEGGMIAALQKPVSKGIAPVFGNGRQVYSWIHIDDLAALFLFMLEQTNAAGIYNAVAPSPVSNDTLVRAYAKSERGKRFAVIPVPGFVLKLMIGEMASDLLTSRTVSCARLVAAGFSFRYTSIETAMKSFTNT